MNGNVSMFCSAGFPAFTHTHTHTQVCVCALIYVDHLRLTGRRDVCMYIYISNIKRTSDRESDSVREMGRRGRNGPAERSMSFLRGSA